MIAKEESKHSFGSFFVKKNKQEHTKDYFFYNFAPNITGFL